MQIIKDLGIFIEYAESDDMKEMLPEMKFKKIVDTITHLGLDLGNDYSCKKVFMLLNK